MPRRLNPPTNGSGLKWVTCRGPGKARRKREVTPAVRTWAVGVKKELGPAPAGQTHDKQSLSLRLGWCYPDAVKISDDYHAKVRLWSRQPRVVALPPGPSLPKFAPQKFRTHEEMNQWKQALLRQVARTVALHG